MSGPVNSFAEIRRALEAPRFDQRPGDLEATRGLIPGPIVVVTSQRDPRFPGDKQGWKVTLLQDGEFRAQLDPAAARKLAGEILRSADICDFGPVL